MTKILQFAIIALAIGFTSAISAGSLTYSQQVVSGACNIFGAGLTSPPDPGGTGADYSHNYGGGVLPPEFALPANPGVLTFSSVTGIISVNDYGPDDLNDPDGVGNNTTSWEVAGYGSLSGIVAPNQGWLVGVFLASGGPSGTAPPMLDFYSTGTSFSSLSPQLDQTFFVGDGLTGDGTGTVQHFVVPAGATQLFLGIADSNSWGGSCGHYDDNDGFFQATFTITSVPEPACLGIISIGAFAFLRRHRCK
jgi:hypothetical protein